MKILMFVFLLAQLPFIITETGYYLLNLVAFTYIWWMQLSIWDMDYE